MLCTKAKCFFFVSLYANLLWQILHINCGCTPHSNVRCRPIEHLFLYDLPQLLGHKNFDFTLPEKKK